MHPLSSPSFFFLLLILRSCEFRIRRVASLNAEESSEACVRAQNHASEFQLDIILTSPRGLYGKIAFLRTLISRAPRQYHSSASSAVYVVSLAQGVCGSNEFTESTKANLAIKLPEEKNQN